MTRGILTLVSTIPVAGGIFIGIFNKTRRRQRGSQYFTLMCLSYAFVFFFYGISIIMEAEDTMIFIGPFFATLATIAQVLHVDAISRDRVDPVKLVILSILATGSVAFQNMGFLLALQVFGITTWTYYAWKILEKVPRMAKKWAKLNLSGVIAVIGSSVWGSFSNAVEQAFPGQFPDLEALTSTIPWELAFGAAFIPISVAYFIEPRLANTLPFIAIRLTVVHTGSGVLLFDHQWYKEGEYLNKELYSATIHGICMILGEAVKGAELNEIQLDKARMLLERIPPHPIVFVLVSHRTSKLFRQGLSLFAELFIKKYGPFPEIATEVTKYRGATNLVEKCFPFALDYKGI